MLRMKIENAYNLQGKRKVIYDGRKVSKIEYTSSGTYDVYFIDGKVRSNVLADSYCFVHRDVDGDVK